MNANDVVLARVAAWSGDGDWRTLDVSRLRAIVEDHGIAFATALFHDRVRRTPFVAALETTPDEIERVPWTVGIVPGGFHVESPHTGADGRLVAEEIIKAGGRAELVPLPSFGRLDANAAIIAEWLRRSDGPVLLVSLSRGASDVRRALERSDAAERFAHVAGWVSLSGTTFGTPLVQWLRRRPLRAALIRSLFWWYGHDFAAVGELARTDGPDLWPTPVRSVHVVGVPCPWHTFGPRTKRGYRRLSPLGPNDGAVLLGDATRLPGDVYPVWGADHYLRPQGQDMGSLVRRIVRHLADTEGTR